MRGLVASPKTPSDRRFRVSPLGGYTLNRSEVYVPLSGYWPVHLGTFGLLLWLAAVAGTIVLHKNFNRNAVDADALT